MLKFLFSRSCVALCAGGLLCACAEEGPVVPKDTVPAGLHAVESTAEDAFDHAVAGDLATLATDAASLDAEWSAFRSSALQAGAMQVDVDATDASVAAFVAAVASETDPLLLARAANAVGSTMDELFAVYAPPTPPAVLVLDYQGRELKLDGLASDFTQGTNDATALRATWSALRARVVGKQGGGTVASRFDGALAAIDTAVAGADAPGLATAVGTELDVVDQIEALFMQAVDPAD